MGGQDALSLCKRDRLCSLLRGSFVYQTSPIGQQKTDPLSMEGDDTHQRKNAWRTRVSWFLREFIVVVTGVLVALALNAWWQTQQDRSFELQYLQQLHQDIENTIGSIERDSQAEEASDRALSMLVRSFRMKPQPPRDSLVAWSLAAPNVLVTVPTIGTAETIVASGDLRLVRNDSLRLALPTFLESSKGLRASMQLFGGQFVEGARDMVAYIDYYGLMQEVVPPAILDSIALANPTFALPAHAEIRSVSGDISRILDLPEVYTLFAYMHTAQRNMTATRQAMLSRNQAMLALVNTALEE